MAAAARRGEWSESLTAATGATRETELLEVWRQQLAHATHALEILAHPPLGRVHPVRGLAAGLGTGGSRWRGAEQQPDDERSGEKQIPRRSGERDQVLHHSSFRLRDKAQLALSRR
jgi:hypothetical protein